MYLSLEYFLSFSDARPRSYLCDNHHSNGIQQIDLPFLKLLTCFKFVKIQISKVILYGNGFKKVADCI